jgi:hypothetical protein
MAIRSRKNQYIGINPHFHSSLQNEPAVWEEFHDTHVIHLGEVIDRLLPTGYLVAPGRSMQIREYHPSTGEPVIVKKSRRPKPDAAILATMAMSSRPTSAVTPQASVPTLLLPATEAFNEDEEIYLTGIVIRELAGERGQGKPIAWLELLSPTNKPDGSGFLQYVEKRATALQGGIVLIELDYLHQTSSPIEKLPSYPDKQKGAYPYTAVVTDPRPSLKEGEMRVYGFAVDEEMPKINIPLLGTDRIVLDLGSVYQRSYESYASYSARVDYAREPERFDTYSPDDQARIKRRMKTVQHYCEPGADLEQAPFPLFED